MKIRAINLRPLLKEMQLEKGKVYTFFGRPAIGKTHTAVEFTSYLWFDKQLRGVFLTRDSWEKLAESVVKWESYHFICQTDAMKYLSEEEHYNFDKISKVVAEHKADFLVIDNVYPYRAEQDEENLILHLKELAQQHNVIVICIAPQLVRFDMSGSPSELLQRAEKTPVAKELIEQSDFVAFLDCWAYFNVSYEGHFNDSMDFIIAKGNYKPTVVNIKHFSEFKYPVGQFPADSVNEWLNK